MKNIILYLIFMLPATLMFIKIIINENGIHKAKASLMWIGVYCFNIVFSVNDQIKELTLVDCGIIIIGIICGYIYSIWFIVKSQDFLERASVVVVWGYISFVFSVSALEIQQTELFCIFKVWLMLTLLVGLLALKNVAAVGQFIGAIILYSIMISVNAILSDEFLTAANENQPWRGIYETIQRIYCLNPINTDLSDANVKTYIVDFFVCRIMDMTLLGFLSAKFMEITGASNVDIRCLKES